MKGINRVNFSNIITKYKSMGKGNVRLTQSSLILMKEIDPNKTVYNFDVLESQVGTIQQEEIRLNINDEFIVTQIGLYLIADIGTAAGTQRKKFLTSGNWANDLQAASYYQPLYQGNLKIAVNNIVYLEKWDTQKHEVVPRTQLKSNTATSPTPSWNSNNFEEDAMYDLAPMLTLSGAKKNEVSLSIPTAMQQATEAFVDAFDNVATIEGKWIGLVFRGLNAQNAAVFQ